MRLLPRRWVLPIDAGWDGRSAGRVLVAVPDRRAVGLGRVLPVGLLLGMPPHQPVLDARQLIYDAAAGQAAVRVHRRRRAASAASSGRRSAGTYARAIGTNNLLLVQPARSVVCCAVVCDDRGAREVGRPGSTIAGDEEKGVSAAEALAPAAVVEAPADHRAGHQLRGDRRGASSSSS